MQRYLSRTRSVAAFMAVAAALCWSSTSLAATPTLGPDCGTGAAIVGSDSAGKVTLGTAPAATCTLAFSVAPLNPPACTATNETNGGGNAVPVGVRTTTTTVEMDGMYPWVPGDIVSYSCTSY